MNSDNRRHGQHRQSDDNRRHGQHPQSEAQLVSRARRGEREALTQLFEAHYTDMRNLALRYMKDPERAEDVLQESCVKVMIHIGQFRGESAFAGWMARIVVNTANMHFRYQNRFVPLNMEAAREWPSDNPDPERMTGSRQLLGQTIDRLRGGRDGDANLFLRRFIGGQSLRLISQDLGISEPSLKTRMHRARIRLKRSNRSDAAV